MNKTRKSKRQKINETLRNAKRAGYRVYPAYRDEDSSAALTSLGNGNYHVNTSRNYDAI